MSIPKSPYITPDWKVDYDMLFDSGLPMDGSDMEALIRELMGNEKYVESIRLVKKSALSFAAHDGYLDLLKYITETFGVSIHKDTSYEGLKYSAMSGNINCFKFCLNISGIHGIKSNNYEAVCSTIENGHKDCLKLMLEGMSDRQIETMLDKLPKKQRRSATLKAALVELKLAE